MQRDWEEETAVSQMRRDLKSGQVAHAYLFTGASGRKQEAVEFFTQGLLCQAEDTPCGICASCTAWERRAHPDFHLLEPDGSSLKIDQVRSWHSFFNYRPHFGGHQVFLLRKPELLTADAANSLLKILEEPLPQTVFLLLTEDDRALLPTIVSRCRVVPFRKQGRDDGEECRHSEKVTELLRLLQEGRESELLSYIRRSKWDREEARNFLKLLTTDLEEIYRTRREMISAGQEYEKTGLILLECLGIILNGRHLLDQNVQVQLLAALTLRNIQKRLQGIG